MNIYKDAAEWADKQTEKHLLRHKRELSKALKARNSAGTAYACCKDDTRYRILCSTQQKYDDLVQNPPKYSMLQRIYRQEYINMVANDGQSIQCPDKGIPLVISQAWSDR